MKLLLCRECGDVFSLSRKDKKCSCGQSSGHYTDHLNATITGPSIPIGFANHSFIKSLKMQEIENAYQQDPTCCKGVEFTAFFIPEVATSIKRTPASPKLLSQKKPNE